MGGSFLVHCGVAAWGCGFFLKGFGGRAGFGISLFPLLALGLWGEVLA